jgi:outer membrane protein
MISTWAARAGLFSLVLATAGIASAQLKVGVVDMRRAILESAEITKASKELSEKYRPRQEEGQRLQKQLSDIQAQLQNGGDKLSPAQQQDLQVQGQRRQRELQRLSDDLQADLDRDRNEVLSKAQVNMRTVVEKLAADKGLDLVLDAGNAVVYKPALDFTQDAITAYNAAHPVK